MSFIAWSVLMGGLILVAFIASKRSKPMAMRAEDVASKALPQIGEIAERQHTMRFGRPPTETPGPPGVSDWYPPLKKSKPARG